MIVVSDSSPIMNLASIQQLAVLEQLYGGITVPPAVYHELVVAGAGQPGAANIRASAWLQIDHVTNRILVTSLQMELDEGEAEAIALAIQLQADLLLLDERRGRTVATRLGLKFIGLLGILLEAKHMGLLQAIKPVLDDLVAKAGFWVTPALYARVLQAAGE
jgi:uncharacterized protein